MGLQRFPAQLHLRFSTKLALTSASRRVLSKTPLACLAVRLTDQGTAGARWRQFQRYAAFQFLHADPPHRAPARLPVNSARPSDQVFANGERVQRRHKCAVKQKRPWAHLQKLAAPVARVRG